MKTNIVTVIPCWGRADIFAVVSKQLDYFYKQTKDKINFTVVYVFSLEDPEFAALVSIFQNALHACDFTISSNSLLGKKLNDGIAYAKKYKYDYIMNFGSDDLIHPKIIDLYMPYLMSRVPLFGINKLYFYEKYKEPIFFSYYNAPHLVGAARMIHFSVINAVNYIHKGLYITDLKRGMDTMSANRMLECGYEQTVVDPGTFPYLVDVKSDININSFESLNQISCTNRITITQTADLINHFPNLNSL